jgi:biopolymer transport protein TolR
MGAGISKKGGRRRKRHAAMSEINVTPMVDVMLVLLIVFMVAAPMMTAGVPVNLPESAAQTISNTEEPLVVSVNEKGEIFLQETKLAGKDLGSRLTVIIGEKKDTVIYIRGDKSVTYGDMMHVMGLVNQAGFNKVSLISQNPNL